MVKKLQINVKNTQIAEALNLSKLKQSAGAAAKKAQAKLKPVKTEEHKPTPAEKKASEEALLKRPKARLLPSIEPAAPLPAEKPIEEPTPLKKSKKGLAEILPEEVPPPSLKEEEISPIPAVLPEEPVSPPVTAEEKKEEALSQKKKEEKAPVEEVKVPVPLRKDEGFREFKPVKKTEGHKAFDSRDRMGLRDVGEEERWRKKRSLSKKGFKEEIAIIRPTRLKVRIPISIKDLASEMKLKASELIAKLLTHGVAATLNDFLQDETTIQLLGQEFGCEIGIDTREEERLRITDKTIKQEIEETSTDLLILRPPVVAFMGHVDHGKTSLIDKIRKANVAATEAGAITQHIGAFSASSPLGNLTILDTPGHEAFSEMRSRGAVVTDIIVLVIAGDEGIREQTIEAIRQAKEAKVPILVALNKVDKAGFDQEKIFRQLADNDLLPESWGGSIITVPCSALTGQGIPELLEMISLQSEILELYANPQARARGTILESEMHKGLGAVATALIQNGTLHEGDAIVFGNHSGRVKTMHNSAGQIIKKAPPSMPVKITGLSDLAEAGCEFIVVKSEKEARELAREREEGRVRKNLLQSKKVISEALLTEKKPKKILALILRADVQGSLEALQSSLAKIHSDKAETQIISSEVGEVSESDISLAAASKATILGFHTRIESHAESLIKGAKVTVRLHDVIYHAIDDVKSLMVQLLDKIEVENDTGTALVKALFKSSKLGIIAGCQVSDGSIKRNYLMRVVRDGELLWKGRIASLKKGKEDIKEVSKGSECGILLEGFTDFKEGDLLQAFEISYLEQTL